MQEELTRVREKLADLERLQDVTAHLIEDMGAVLERLEAAAGLSPQPVLPRDEGRTPELPRQ